MSVPAMIVDKLRNYEYEKCGAGFNPARYCWRNSVAGRD